MLDELYKQLIALALGGIIGVAFKYWYDYKGMVHKELWIKRYDAYKTMFSVLGNFPLYPEKAVVSYNGLYITSRYFKEWFFSEGGMLLSSKTRTRYFKVQKKIQTILEAISKTNMDETITVVEYESVRNLMSQFRRAMTDDLMSRMRM